MTNRNIRIRKPSDSPYFRRLSEIEPGTRLAGEDSRACCSKGALGFSDGDENNGPERDFSSVDADFARDEVFLDHAREAITRKFLGPQFEVGVRRAGVSRPKMNVFAVGIGEKISAGLPTGRFAVVVHVKEKVPYRCLARDLLIPPFVTVFGRRILTDVQEMGEPTFAIGGGSEIYTKDPLQIGTIGCIVERGGKRYALTNYHVAGKFGQEPLGTSSYSKGGVLIGKLQDFIAVHPHTQNGTVKPDNYADAALIEIDPNANVLPDIAGIAPVSASVYAPKLGRTVKKSGSPNMFMGS